MGLAAASICAKFSRSAHPFDQVQAGMTRAEVHRILTPTYARELNVAKYMSDPFPASMYVLGNDCVGGDCLFIHWDMDGNVFNVFAATRTSYKADWMNAARHSLDRVRKALGL